MKIRIYVFSKCKPVERQPLVVVSASLAIVVESRDDASDTGADCAEADVVVVVVVVVVAVDVDVVAVVNVATLSRRQHTNCEASSHACTKPPLIALCANCKLPTKNDKTCLCR